MWEGSPLAPLRDYLLLGRPATRLLVGTETSWPGGGTDNDEDHQSGGTEAEFCSQLHLPAGQNKGRRVQGRGMGTWEKKEAAVGSEEKATWDGTLKEQEEALLQEGSLTTPSSKAPWTSVLVMLQLLHSHR